MHEFEFASSPHQLVAFWRGSFSAVDGNSPSIPFVDAFEEWLANDVRELQVAQSVLEDSAVASFSRNLATALADLCAQPIIQRLLVNKAGQGISQDSIDVQESLSQLPTLKSLAQLVRDRYLTHLSKLIERWIQDEERLRTKLNLRSTTIKKVDMNLSEWHAGGCVCAISTGSRRSVVYKPRNVASEFHWNELLDVLSSIDPSIQLPKYRVLAETNYGWCEYMDGGEPRDLHETSFQFGALLGLAWILCATDLHAENTRFSASGPLVLDVETLFQSPSRLSGSWEPIGMLPSPLSINSSLGSSLVDLSALGAQGKQPIPWQIPDWRVDRDDVVSLEYHPACLVHSLGSEHQPPSLDVELLAKGMRNVFFAVRSRPDALLASSPFVALCSQPQRVIPRNTRDYYLAMNASLLASSLADPMTRRQIIATSLQAGENTPDVAAILRLEVPRYEEMSTVAARTKMIGDRIGQLTNEKINALERAMRMSIVLGMAMRDNAVKLHK